MGGPRGSGGGVQLRRLPVVDRDKPLVCILSLGDVAVKADGTAGKALGAISRPAVRRG